MASPSAARIGPAKKMVWLPVLAPTSTIWAPRLDRPCAVPRVPPPRRTGRATVHALCRRSGRCRADGSTRCRREQPAGRRAPPIRSAQHVLAWPGRQAVAALTSSSSSGCADFRQRAWPRDRTDSRDDCPGSGWRQWSQASPAVRFRPDEMALRHPPVEQRMRQAVGAVESQPGQPGDGLATASTRARRRSMASKRSSAGRNQFQRVVGQRLARLQAGIIQSAPAFSARSSRCQARVCTSGAPPAGRTSWWTAANAALARVASLAGPRRS